MAGWVGRARMRVFQGWFRLSRPMTLGARALVERSDGKIALVRHTYTPGLYLPGGGVEKGEPATAALQRELVEEIGADLSARARLLGIFSNHAMFPNDHVLLYHVPPAAWRACAATSRGEIAEVVWTDPGDPPPDATPATRRRLLEWHQKADLSDHW